MATLQIIRGDNETIGEYIMELDGEAVDITDWTFFFTIKETPEPLDLTDASALLKKSYTVHADPTGGRTLIDVVHDDTKNITPGLYYWDVEYVKPGVTEVKTVDSGRIRIKADVSQRVV